MTLEAEFTIEPFRDGEPGPHVQAALDTARDAGLDPDFGPFGTSVRGDDDVVLRALDLIVRAAVDRGATRVSVQLTRVD